MSNEILSLQNISLSYDNKKTYVLKDISFSVVWWEILSIIWLNGSGKSSLLKIISWVQKQTSWNVVRNYKNISYVPQKINLEDSFPILVKEFIGIYNQDVDIQNVEKLLSKFHAQELIHKRVDRLSSWQLQKVLIVSALLSSPDIILLDEPTAGIDIIWEEIFYEMIKDVKNHFPNISIVLVSHNIKLVYKNSDKVICLHENNFCCHGTPTEISTNPIIQSLFWEYTLPYQHKPHAYKVHEWLNH